MAEERLQITLEADVKQAIAGLAAASNELKDLGTNGAKNLKQLETGLQELRKVRAGAETAEDLALANTAIGGLSKQVSGLKKPLDDAGKGFDNVKKKVPNAANTITNAGRLLSDLPFAIISGNIAAISNNIDPLTESFGRLKTSTKETGGPMKALGAALAGPAGIGLAITVVTGALVLFGPQIKKAITGVSEFDQTLRDAGTKGAEAFSKATDTFGNFLRVVNDSEASVTRQNQALEGANKAISEYGLEIGSISQLQKQGAAIGAIYAQIKQEEAKSSILAAKAAEEYAKGVALGIAIEQGDTLGAAGALSVGNLVKALLTGGTAIGSAATAVAGLGDAFGVANAKQKAYETENEKTKIGIDNLIKSLGQVPGVVEKSDKAKAKSIEVSKAQAKEDTIINTQRKAALLLVNQETAGLLALSAAADKAFQAKQKSSILDKQKDIQSAGGPTALPGRGIDPRITAVSENLKLLQEDAIITAAVFSGALGPAVDTVFNALANGDNVFEALGESLKSLVVELVKAIAKALILKAITTAIGGGAGGFFSSTVGQAISGVLGGRAAGGPVVAGGGYIVGENGPEKFYPSTSGMITPNDVGGGAGGQFEFVIAGNTLRAIQRRADTSFGRLNG